MVLSGSCTFAETTTCGSLPGAIPMKLDPYLHSAQFGPGSCAVPVLAAPASPGMRAHGALPAASSPGTCCRIWTSSCAVFGWITRRDGDGAAGVYWPLELY